MFIPIIFLFKIGILSNNFDTGFAINLHTISNAVHNIYVTTQHQVIFQTHPNKELLQASSIPKFDHNVLQIKYCVCIKNTPKDAFEM